MSNRSLPRIMIVGRTNVGKSTLFNRLVDNKKSIVFSSEGVTRDYLEETMTWDKRMFRLVDTGGVMTKRQVRNEIEKNVQAKLNALLQEAALFLFVCDGKNGLTDEDRIVARQLHTFKKPTLLLLNKADNISALQTSAPEFLALGFSDIIEVSAIHGIGINNLLAWITDHLPEDYEETEEQPHYHVSIVGKPNVGKSSLMNELAKRERSIVSDIAGTTREAVSERIYHCNDLIELIDTAGVRKKSRVDDELEQLMVKSSLSAIRQADIVILMVDASAGKISDQELKLLFYALEEKKPVILLINKVDLLTDYTKSLLDLSKEEYDFILKKVPVISTSCKTKQGVDKVLKVVAEVWHRCKQNFDPAEVDEVVKKELDTKALFRCTIPLKLHKIRPLPTAKIPSFVLHVNYPQFFGPAELSCIENILRRHFDLRGCPVQFSVKKH